MLKRAVQSKTYTKDKAFLQDTTEELNSGISDLQKATLLPTKSFVVVL